MAENLEQLKKRLAELSPEKRELLLAKLRKAKSGETRTPAKIQPRSDASVFPMSYGQKGFWVLEQLNPGLAVNNIPAALRLKGPLNFSAFKKAFEFIIKRHQILRVRFDVQAGQPRQELRDFDNLELPVFDLTGFNKSEQEEKVAELITEEATRPFDLSKDLLVRVQLLKLADDEHVLSVTFHHIIADAWSVGVFVNEYLTAYQAFSTGKAPDLPELPIQYFDYAAWHQAFIEGPQGQKQIAYWEKQLGDPEGHVQLPTDFPRTGRASHRGFHLPFYFDETVSQKILDFCQQEQITPYMFLQAVFALMLAHLSGQDDIRIASPVANRNQPELKHLIGLFINVVIIKNVFPLELSFRSFLQQVRQTVLDAMDNATVPIEILINKFFPKRESSDNPLANVLFDFQTAPLQTMRLGDLEVESLKLETGSIKFDLVLSVNVTQKGIKGIFGYKTELFKKETIEKFISYFRTLVNSVLQNPDRALWRYSLLDQVERDRILNQWSRGPAVSMPDNLCIHQLIAQRAETNPDVPALIHHKHIGKNHKPLSLTYRELNERANQVAHYLMKKGVGPGHIIGLCTKRSLELFVGLLGILKTGAAYLPIDPNYPEERIEFIINDSNLSFVLTQSALRQRFDDKGIESLCLDSDWSIFAKQSTANPQGFTLHPETLAYLIYTSGSTGTPKAVMVPHRALLNHALAMRDEYDFKIGERILQYISISFDAAGEEIYPALLSGATLILPTSAAELSGFDLLEILETEKVNVLHVPVPVWHYFIDFLTEQNKKIPESIRLMLAGGEQPSIPKFKKAAELAQRPTAFVNLYGPTETTIASTFCHLPLKADQTFEYGFIPIGKPIHNESVYILNKALQPVPQGVVGEIYIGGIGVTLGYLGRPDLTAERFLPDPFSSEPGARMYRTGDLGRFNSRGEIIFAGRADYQVKIRGFRVELGEIEAVLAKHPSVAQCVVFTHQDNNQGEKKIVAYIVPQDEKKLDINDLREFVAQKLPDYMVPSYFVALDKIPLTPTGKVNRRALPDPTEAGTRSVSANYVPPTSKLELFLYEMWKEILGIEKIGIHDNFFQLGGSSIQAATFVNRLQDALGEYVYIVAIYDAPTIAQLCALLKKDYPESVYRITGEKVESYEEKERISQENVDFLRSIIKTPAPFVLPEKRKNPPAVFVISSPRSGSTLTRAILGGHPKLFSPPELQLLNFNTLRERKQNLTGRDDFWLDGTIRAIMEIKKCSADEARQIMSEFEEKDYTVKDFYYELQQWLNDQIFVDKTPNYALSVDILKRAEMYFEDALYIHLIRHPYGVIPSFEKARLHVFYPPFFTDEHPFTPRQLAELIWLISHQNILTFLKEIPKERQFRLYYEDLVTDPEKTVKKMCDFLGIDLHPDMLDPQKDSHKRMTDGLNDLSKMLGDVRFHEHKGITADRAYSWKRTLTEDYLSDLTWKLVEDFGYESRSKLEYSLGKVIRPIEPLKPGETPPLSFAQQRLWFLDQLEPDNPFYNMPLTERLKGRRKHATLQKALNKVVERHENLRTAFVTVDGQPTVKIEPRLHVPIRTIDLSTLSEKEQDKKIRALIQKEAATPFNLSTAPLFRSLLIKTAENEYIFILNMHHIISDGMSLEIMLKEISAFYQAIDNEAPDPLPPLPLQYGAYAKWQRAWLESAVLQKQLRFWQDQLQGVPHLLQLPTDFPRPRVQSFRGQKAFFELPDELSARLKELANRYQTTPYVVLLTAFSVLLHRYSGQNDLCIGTPVSGRTRREVEGLIGFFVNSLPLRFELEDNPNFDQLLPRVQTMFQNALSNQDVPFEKIIDALQLERDTSYTPLFQVMFIYQQNPLKKIALRDLEIEPLQVDTGTAKFDLSLAIVEDAQQFRGMFEFNSDLFRAQTIERMINHFHNLLKEIVSDSQKPVLNLNLLSEEEKKHIVQGYNRFRQQEVKPGQNVVNLFEARVKSNPDQTAIIFHDQKLSYQFLNERANQLAHYLRSKGVGHESIVGLSLERSPDLIIGLLGILKAGAAYLPIDPAYPEERIAYIVEDSQINILVTQRKLSEQFKNKNLDTVCIDDLAHPFLQQPLTNPQVPIEPENIAYLIYTSGSTGKPKAVMVPHGSLVNHALAMQKIYHIQPEDRMLQYISISFDASAEEIYPTLTGGATLVLAPAAGEISGNDFLNLINEHKISILHLPVPVWHYLIDFFQEQKQPIPESVRLMLVGGEAPSVQKLSLSAKLTNHPLTFMNLYGPTEATITTTCFQLDLKPNQQVELNVIPIGTPIPNARVYILDEALQPVPSGVVGEIYIGGSGITRGYLNRADITAERFIPDPFSSTPGARLYRTGDLGRFTSTGDIIFVGRRDFQVKVRGFRIELGEIETALEKHPAVKQAIVLAKGDERNTRLVAYIIPEKDVSLTIAELRSFLGSTLPEYMVPSYFVAMEKFPTTPTGKVDRKRLPEPHLTRDELGDDYVPPRNDKEKILVEIWQELLKLPKIGVKDNFFELGGDSILSIQVIARANQKGLKITPKQLFEYPTIEGLAAVAEEGVAIQAEQGLVSGTFPLTPIQKWFFNLKLEKPHHWNQSLTIELTEALDREILTQVAEKIIEQHDILRVRFVPGENGFQADLPEKCAEVPFYFHDLKSLKGKELKTKISELSNRAQSGFNLQKGPLIRFDYFSTSEKDLLQISIHHLVVDTVSWRILTEDILQTYRQLKEENRVALPPKTTSFKYWAEKLNQYANSPEIEAELEFWRQQTTGDIPALPVDNEQGKNLEKFADSVKKSLTAQQTEQLLREAPAAYNTQINELLLAALLRAYHRWSGNSELLVDLEGHGREDLFEEVNISRTVGWFTVNFPLRLKYNAAWETAELIRQVKELYRAIPQHGIGYGLLRYLREEESLAPAKAPNIGFNYLGQFDQSQEQSSALGKPVPALSPERALENRRIHLIDIGGSVVDNVLNMNFSFSTDLFKRETVENFASLFMEELGTIIEHCLSDEAGGYTASDFKEAEIDDEDLDALLEELE